MSLEAVVVYPAKLKDCGFPPLAKIAGVASSGSTLVTAGRMGVLLTMVKSHFSPYSAVSLLPFSGSLSAGPVMGHQNHLAAFLTYFLVLFPQFCRSCLPCTLAPSTQELLGKGQPPLCTEQPEHSCAPQQEGGRGCFLLAAAALEGQSKADGTVLNEQPATE